VFGYGTATEHTTKMLEWRAGKFHHIVAEHVRASSIEHDLDPQAPISSSLLVKLGSF